MLLKDCLFSSSGMSIKVPCRVPGCTCKAFQWIPNKPADIGEFWLAKRPNFDAEAWRAKCRCKHTHNFHDPQRPHRCKAKGLSSVFLLPLKISSFLFSLKCLIKGSKFTDKINHLF